VKPALTYGAAVLARRTQVKATTQKLNTVQRLGLMMVPLVRLRTPIAGLEILLGVPPLVMHIQQLAVGTANQLSLTPKEWTGSYGRKLGHIAWLASTTRQMSCPL
jgi:hypothetical protein